MATPPALKWGVRAGNPASGAGTSQEAKQSKKREGRPRATRLNVGFEKVLGTFQSFSQKKKPGRILDRETDPHVEGCSGLTAVANAVLLRPE